MQASRLLATMMLLQTHGQLSAAALAERLEVSVRTIYRDITQLSAAGVPVYAERGRGGGIRLLDGWQTTLTGLTGDEARAVVLAGLPEPAARLGLGPALGAAQAKLLAALPEQWQAEALQVTSRFHLDVEAWYRPASGSEQVEPLARAVWAEQRIRVRYESWVDTADRVLDPLGLVLKAGTWYLVARGGRRVRTYRISNMHTVEVLDEKFVRPRRFDLATHWRASTSRFEADILRETASLRLTEPALRALERSSAHVARAIAETRRPSARASWFEITIPIESVEHAANQVIALGDGVEVVAPASLRAQLAATARRLLALYDVTSGDHRRKASATPNVSSTPSRLKRKTHR